MAKKKNEAVDFNLTIKDPAIEPYEIKVDDMCFNVVRVLISKEKNNRIERPVGYFGNFSAALKRIAHNKVVSENKKLTVLEYIEKYEQVVKHLEQTVKQ